MKRAFTLIELVVAVAILAMVLSFASVIFRVSIEAYRTAGANTEIMQKLRAVTDQLNADFKGAMLNRPGLIRFNVFGDVRSDSIVFFANGDFQSTRQYDGKTVVGNVACIYYGQAVNPDPNTGEPKEKILLRRQTILTSESSLPTSDSNSRGEYYMESLAEWVVDPPFSDLNDWIERPGLNPDDGNDLVMYMAKGVDDFTIQYVGWDYGDPNEFEFNQWRPENGDIIGSEIEWKNKFFFPLAFKFTFTLYDSKGIIENGRRFTHVVYLGN